MSKRAVWVAMALLLGCLAQVAFAQDEDKKHESNLRTVHGTVVDAGENALATAVVYLKNRKTGAVKTYISDDSGHYRFSGLDPNVDYEVRAEHDNLTSPTRGVSSFDSRKDIDITLKVNKPKKSGK